MKSQSRRRFMQMLGFGAAAGVVTTSEVIAKNKPKPLELPASRPKEDPVKQDTKPPWEERETPYQEKPDGSLELKRLGTPYKEKPDGSYEINSKIGTTVNLRNVRAGDMVWVSGWPRGNRVPDVYSSDEGPYTIHTPRSGEVVVRVRRSGLEHDDGIIPFENIVQGVPDGHRMSVTVVRMTDGSSLKEAREAALEAAKADGLNIRAVDLDPGQGKVPLNTDSIHDKEKVAPPLFDDWKAAEEGDVMRLPPKRFA